MKHESEKSYVFLFNLLVKGTKIYLSSAKKTAGYIKARAISMLCINVQHWQGKDRDSNCFQSYSLFYGVKLINAKIRKSKENQRNKCEESRE